MVVLLVLMTIIGFLAADLIMHPNAWKRTVAHNSSTQDIYNTEIGLTMADGGEPIKKEDK